MSGLRYHNVILGMLACVATAHEASFEYFFDACFGSFGEGRWAIGQFEWIVVVGGIAAFMAAFGIGANDVANAYASSVGAGSLSVRQAVVLAAIFETSGAILLGSHVTKTIRKGIADAECFEDHPALLMYGMFCVILVVGFWLVLASTFELPVSTTHSTVGGIIGMTLLAKGSGCVKWYEEEDSFPFVGGVWGIVLSWVISPVFSGLFAAALFYVVRAVVLRGEGTFRKATIFYPLLVGAAVVVNMFFIIFKGGKGLDWDETTLEDALLISFIVGCVVALFMAPLTIKNFLGLPFRAYLTEHIESRYAAEAKAATATTPATTPATDVEMKVEPPTPESRSRIGRLASHVSANLDRDFTDTGLMSAATQDIHDSAEVFAPKTEFFFRYIQVFTAVCDSFAHGANDVANSIGPFAAIYTVYREHGVISSKAELGDDAYWMLALGGVGIAAGLALYGYKVMYAVGVKLTKISPSRGFCIELGAALVIIVGSFEGWPLSTTHCQVGATVGVGLLEGRTDAINWRVLLKVALGWVLTLVVVGCTTALVMAQAVYAPSVVTYNPAFDPSLTFYNTTCSA